MDFPTLPIPQKRILVVEGDQRVRRNIVKTLEIEGYQVHDAGDGLSALKYMDHALPDLIISDINAPGTNGIPYYHQVRTNAAWTTIPFIFLVNRGRQNDIQRARESAVEDYVQKPGDSDGLVRIVHARLLRSAELKLALIDQHFLETIELMANVVEGRDPYTHGHISRVSAYAQMLAEALNWPEEQIRILKFGALLHDVGKITVPDQILKKPGDLTPEEWELMRKHPEAGAKILSRSGFLKPAINYVLHHHERWDGSGYPHGLSGRDIPIEGRLLAIADVYDALTTHRPYHPARPPSEVFKFLAMRAGTQFDPDMVPIFIQMMEQQMKGQA